MSKITVGAALLSLCWFPGLNEWLSAQVSMRDSLALVALYNSTDGANWTNNDNWLSGPVSTWYGIAVAGGRVRDINLHRNNLAGILPREIGDLDQLSKLGLSVNELSGSIPADIGNLTNLVSLVLNQNKLTGTIPVEIGNLTALRSLFLNVNQLTGSIPYSVGNLIQLEYVSFYGNQLSGELPSGMQNWEKLIELNLSENQLTGGIPDWIGNWTQLTSLSLGRNQFSGLVPAAIGNLTSLSYLYLASGQLSGSIPAEIGNLTNLTQLYLNTNQLSGSIPDEIGNLTQLTTLHCDRNELTGAIPQDLYHLINLSSLRLYDNHLSGTISTDIGNLINLTQLWLHVNQFTDSIPAAMGRLVNLQYLYLMENQFSGAIPTEFAQLDQLINLDIHDNLFTDLPDLSSDTSLTDLLIHDNRLTFEDIEPNLFVERFTYSPQDSIGEKQDTTIDLGARIEFSVHVGGTANHYQWAKDGIDIPGSTGSSFSIESVKPSDRGDYVCRVSNTLANDLMLYSRPIHVIVPGGAAVDEPMTTMLKDFTIYQNYPNPFNSQTMLKYCLPQAAHVSIAVYDLGGRRIKKLSDSYQQAGQGQAAWNGADEGGRPAATGLYFCCFDAAEVHQVIKLILIK